MASSNSDVWRILRRLETEEELICPLKAEVRIVRRKAGFLKAFLSCRGKWNIEDGNLQALLFRIQTVFQTADHDLRRLWVDFINIPSENYLSMPLMPMNMDNLLSHMLERYELLSPDIQEVYTILSESSRSITDMNDEAAKENLNSLIEQIEDLLIYDAEFVAPVKEELEAVQKSLRFLRSFLSFTAKRCSKLGKLKDILIHTEFLADNISCLLYLCSVNDKVNDRMANEMKMQLSSELQKFSPSQPDAREIYIKALKASKSAQVNSNLVDKFGLDFLDSLREDILVLSDTNFRFTTPIKNQILSLYEELRFLITYFARDSSSEEHIENHQIFKYLSELISAVIDETGYVICSLLDEEMASELELNEKVSGMLAIIGAAKEDTKKMYDLYVPKSLRYDFPRTNGQGFIGSLLRNLKELLSTKADLVAPLKHHIGIVQKELLSVKEDFSETAEQPCQCEVLQSQWTRFIDTAYQTEYVVDSFVAGDGALWCHKLGLLNVIEEIKTIKIELKATKSKMTSVHKPTCIPTQISLVANSPIDNAVLRSQERLADKETTTKLVIFEEEAISIRERLTNRSQKLNFLSIVGMPGIGKTTLADSVFQHPSVTHYFHVRARCSVSQVHDKRRLLREILQEVTGESNQYNDDDLEQTLYQRLKGRRFLIFMDDIWDIQPWEDIRKSFPDDKNGSRIIFTSRFDGIASQAGSESVKFHLSPLSEDKSWEMLRAKMFGNKSCPQELERVGREIAAKCKGLPLTVELIAGLLRVTEREKWEKVAESMTTLLFDDPQGRCQKVLELSYNNLPDELKPCFLYFAAFPEDADVPTRKLILLWIAEGFVQLQRDDQRSLEGAAEEILNDLIARNLVTVSKRIPMGGVKASRIHDLLLEFALAKAQEESFMLKMDSETGYQWQDYYRLCIHLDNPTQIHESNLSGRRARALLISYPWGLHHRLNLSEFKLLKVLDIPDGYCDAAIFTLIHLRFLSVFAFDTYEALSKIHKLRNLETFVLTGFHDPIHLSLDKICNMVKLRHFYFSGYFSFKILEKSFLFDNLRTLKGLEASYAEDIEKILKLMPNLVKLKVQFYNPDGDRYRFPKLDFLKKLESLEVTHENCRGRVCIPCKIISFPPYIKKLALINFRVPWTEISEIGNFECLEILKLKKQVFVGPIWNMIDGQFPKLKCLSLSYMDIEELNASEDHLSCLEQLHMERCWKLKELPSCLAEIATLQKIELVHCNKSAEKSAERIKKEQEETGNEQLVVDIKSRVEDKLAYKWERMMDGPIRKKAESSIAFE